MIGGQLRELAAKVSEATDITELEELAEVAVEVIEWRVENLPALEASDLLDDGDVIDADVVDESYEARSEAAVLAALRQQQRSRIVAEAEARRGVNKVARQPRWRGSWARQRSGVAIGLGRRYRSGW